MKARALLVALLWMGAGCTFTGLGRYDIGRCDLPKGPTSLDDDPCAALDGPSTGCLRYQCDVATGTCSQRALDFDRDGEPAITCGGHDCDDRDGRRTSTGVEICDGADNDCNGVADDDLVTALSTRALLALPASFREASLTSSNGRDLVGAAVVDDAAGPCILAFRGTGESLGAPCTFPVRAGITPRQPAVRPIVAEDLTFGAAFVTAPASCPQGQIGFRSSKGGAVDGACVAGGASLPSFLPYPNGKAVVVVYLGRTLAAPAGTCPTTTAAPLDAVWIDRPTATSADPQPRVYSQRLALGSSLSTRAPALAPLGDAVLLAAPADGAVGVWSLRAPLPDGSGESVVPLLAPAALDALGGARAVAVALDALEGNRRLAIVAEIGCADAQRIVMVIAQLAEPGPVVSILHVVEVAAPSARAAAPQVAWLDGRKEWWVTWLGQDQGDALMVRRFNTDGLPAGAALTAAPGALLGAPNAEASRGASAALDTIDARGLAESAVGCR
jgi:Putative metal-binding motif